MNVFVLTFNWYEGIDGSGSDIVGVFSTKELCEKALENFINENELSDREYSREWMEILELTVDTLGDGYNK